MSRILGLKLLLIVLILSGFYQEVTAQENSPAKFVFEGNKAFSSTELSNVLEKCLKNAKENNPASDINRMINWCLQVPVRRYMYDKGYSKASIGNLVKGRKEELIIPVTEGDLYYLGEVSVDGEKAFAEQEILKDFPLKKGEKLNSTLLFQWISSLQDSYADRGFIQFNCEPEPTYSDNIINIKFIMDEGPMFRIGQIDFVNYTNLRNNYLKKYLTFEEGEIFSQQKLKESIGRLNNLNMFQKIDADKDVRFIASEEIPVINLRINIKADTNKKSSNVIKNRKSVNYRFTERY